jgi:hypothetical protein
MQQTMGAAPVSQGTRQLNENQQNSHPNKIANQHFATLMAGVLATGSTFRFEAPGFSMAPMINNGDILTLAPLVGQPPRLGDVLAFIRPATGSPVVHRVVAVRKDHYLLKGDHGRTSDGWIPTDQLLGRVIRVERNQHTIKVGFGLERYPIAVLSRVNLLQPALRVYWLFIGRFRVRRAK